ncbi:hypothetical protein C8J57DRAFT_1350190, partial [Mycena rebaudengoi]
KTFNKSIIWFTPATLLLCQHLEEALQPRRHRNIISPRGLGASAICDGSCTRWPGQGWKRQARRGVHRLYTV